MKIKKILGNILSDSFRERTERVAIWVAIISFLIHLLIILLVNTNIIHLNSKLTSSAISAVYTPFSFILVFEVFLLVFYLPKSISIYIGKQYEIMTLIVIRRIFKDIGNLEMSANWFKLESNLQFLYDMVTALLLFFLIQKFYQKLEKKGGDEVVKTVERKSNINKFIQLKKTIAVILIPILIALAFYSFGNWIYESVQDNWSHISSFKNINNIFFEDFFMLLIIIDVILLLFSLFYFDSFQIIIRNSGFVISTILIKLSFSAHGIINNVLILSAVVFGYLILVIHNSYKKNTLLE